METDVIEKDAVERKECFGSIQEITDKNGFTTTESRPECRNCQEIRDCLHYAKLMAEKKKEEDELRKQNMIAQVIDLSQIISNELGSCLLEFLSRIYNSPVGTILFKHPLLFFEVPHDKLSTTVTIPISPSTLDLIYREEAKEDPHADQQKTDKKEARRGFTLQVVLIQRHFYNNQKANMGLIAYEVARLFSSDNDGIHQILQVLSKSESNLFKKIDVSNRIDWLMERWGFRDEFDALRKEMETFKPSE
jgi:hypothetical protein